MNNAEYRALVDELLAHDTAYYVHGRPTISDLEYDGKFNTLKAYEKNHPAELLAYSPSQRAGSDLSSDFPEFRHTLPVLSLDKAYSLADIAQFTNRMLKTSGSNLRLVGEQKIDGLSIVLYYENGYFSKAVTRGNGEVGNDVSVNARTIRDIPLKLTKPVTGAFRGEVYMEKSVFLEINSRLETPYANPRNLAGGSLRRIKSSEVASVPLRIFMYEGFYEGSPSRHEDILSELRALGLRTNEDLAFFDLPSEQGKLEEFIQEQTKNRPSLGYEIDGLVFKIDDTKTRDLLGYTGHHPRWAVAYKFDSPEGVTKLLSIDVQLGRTGRVTPVARVSPVSVGGATISNITLHNQDYIDSLELAIGDSVTISRRGDVIPAVENVVEKGEGLPWHMPANCPCCHSKLEIVGAHHFCKNYECLDRARGRLVFFTSRDQMDIEGLGPETLEVLMNRGLVKDIPDLYTADYDSLAQVQGFGEKKIEGLKASIERSKKQSFKKLIPSLGISDFGTKFTELLLENGYTEFTQIMNLFEESRENELLKIRGIGEKTLETVKAEMLNDRFKSMIAKLMSYGLQFTYAPEANAKQYEQIFTGQSWCVTGSFESFKPRDLAMDEVKKRGGRVVSDVSSATSHLLAGEKAGSKLEKAQKLGVIVVNESEFLELISEA